MSRVVAAIDAVTQHMRAGTTAFSCALEAQAAQDRIAMVEDLRRAAEQMGPIQSALYRAAALIEAGEPF